MKISENRRMRVEKKSKARHAHQERQNSRFSGKFETVAQAIAAGGKAAQKLDFAEVEKILNAAGKNGEDLAKRVDEIRAEQA